MVQFPKTSQDNEHAMNGPLVKNGHELNESILQNDQDINEKLDAHGKPFKDNVEDGITRIGRTINRIEETLKKTQ